MKKSAFIILLAVCIFAASFALASCEGERSGEGSTTQITTDGASETFTADSESFDTTLSTGDPTGDTSSESTGDVTEGESEDTDTAPESETAAPEEEIVYIAEITIEDYGTITLELDSTEAPITVENFVKLSRSGFYDGLTFHRIIEGFMMQGGDPEGNGTGGSDENIKGEFKKNGVDNDLSHVRGAISMARAQSYNSASSQFFIVHEDSKFLDGQYAAFGYVTDGMDIVDKICEDADPTDGNGTIKKSEQPVIKSVTIREK